MKVEISESPIRFQLYGVSGLVEDERYGETGFRLMNEMWRAVKAASIPTLGMNHWVYLPDSRMFVGVELCDPQPCSLPRQLEPLAFELRRYLKHVHVGPYEALPQKWSELKSALSVRGEVIDAPSLEVYGHHCDDQSKQETTIFISLPAKTV